MDYNRLIILTRGDDMVMEVGFSLEKLSIFWKKEGILVNSLTQPNWKMKDPMDVDHLQNVLGAIPFSTLSIIAILFAFRYDMWQQMVWKHSANLGVSETMFVIICLSGIFGIMVIGALIWKTIEYVRTQTTAGREAIAITDRERAALIAIFNSLNGHEWRDKTRWCSDEPLYRWKGVHLDPHTHRVNKLILNDKNVSGKLIVQFLA